MNRRTLSAEVYRDPKDPNAIPHLEENVTNQLNQNTHDMEANLALLKFYQYYPQYAKPEFIQKVLIKSLMNIKDNTFAMALFLIPEKYHKMDAITGLIQLADSLESAKYKAFWALVDHYKDFLLNAEGFDNAIRDFILDVVSITFRTVDSDFLKESLNFVKNDAELEAYLKTKSFSLSDGALTFPLQESAAANRGPQGPQTIPLEQILKVW